MFASGRLNILLVIFSVLLMPASANSGQLEDGQAAAKQGDYARALSLLLPLAAQGNAVAQTSLGLMYRDGRGVPQDDKQAVAWFRKAATQGEADAQLALEHMHQVGLGVPKDAARAKSSSEEGHHEAG